MTMTTKQSASTLLVMLLSAVLLSCGGGSKAGSPPTLQAILNGQSLATATSYWACENCVPNYVIGIEFTADGAFQTIVTGSGPTSATCTGSVTYPPGQPAGTEIILGGACSVPGLSVEKMGGILGSTSSGGFAATSTTVSMNQDATYNGCSFTLVQGKQN